VPFDKDGKFILPESTKDYKERTLREKKEKDAARFDSTGKVVLPSEKEVQYTRPSDTAKYDPEREMIGVKTPISMESLEGLYDNYKSGKVSFDSLSFDTQELLTAYITKNLSRPDIYINLSTTNRIKFDENKDGVISKQEYKIYTEAKDVEIQKTLEISSDEKKQGQIELLQAQNSKHEFFYFDATVLISVGFLCITAIVITLIIARTRSRRS
jgi:hypothetical protein